MSYKMLFMQSTNNMVKLNKIILLLFLFVSTLYSKELEYKVPQKFDFLYNVKKDMIKIYDIALDKKNIKTWSIITALTLTLIYYDDKFIRELKRLGIRLSIPPIGIVK